MSLSHQCRQTPLLNKNVTCYKKYMYNHQTVKCLDGGLITGIQYWIRYQPNLYAISCCHGLPKAAESCTADKVIKVIHPTLNHVQYNLALTVSKVQSFLSTTKIDCQNMF